MAILIDEPRWPAHGTRWAHLVSDTSLAELHAFAAANGLPRRSFDLDHYDVPAERHADLVTAGAQPVDRATMVRRLRASGVRVIAADRPAWRRLAGQWDATVADTPDIALELLSRWSAPGRAYHGLGHLSAVLDRLTALADGGAQVTRSVIVAAWFHDAVHDGQTPADELASAQLAATLLDGVLSPAETAEVGRLVRLTIDHVTASDDAPGQALCDADLGVLGGSPQEYLEYTVQVRQEYASVPEAAFRSGRAAILRAILDRPAIYRTQSARQLWEEAARRNVTAELDRLTG